MKKPVIIVSAVLAAIVAVVVIFIVPMTRKKPVDLGLTGQQEGDFMIAYGMEEFQVGRGWANGCLLMGNTEVDKEVLKEFQKNYTVEEVKIPASSDGHEIPADYILANNNKNCDTVIVLHGHGGNRRSMPSIEYDFLELGYNVFAFDFATAGENYGKLATYGLTDQYELLDCINYVKGQMSSDKKLVVCGWSYGGGVLGVSLGNPEIDEKIDMAILDCPVTDFNKFMAFYSAGEICSTEEEAIECVNFEYEAFNNFTEMMYGFRISDASAEKSIQTTKTPVLVFTSKADEEIPCDLVTQLYEAIPHDQKYIKVFDEVPHVAGSWDDSTKDVYKQTVSDFLKGELY